jgi:HB1/ASXL restriction endonuclease-like protein with HTH domain
MAEIENRDLAYDAVLNDLRTRREQEIQEVARKYDTAIAAIEALKGGVITVESTDAMGQKDSPESVLISIGEFHGMPFTNAARAILQKTNRRPLRTNEIVSYIERSGRKVEGKNPSGTIYSSLKRNPDFELVAPNTWGLAEWYGHKRKPKSVAARTEEIMKDRSISIAEAAKQAQAEAQKAS